MLSVAEIMTREPYALGPQHTLGDAVRLMAEHHIHHIPIVTPDQTVTGIVSHRDVLAASQADILHGEIPVDGDEVTRRLSAIMSTPVQTVAPDANLLGVAVQLRTQRLGCLPVTEDNRLVGIISDSDFLEVAISLLEQMEMSEPEEDY